MITCTKLFNDIRIDALLLCGLVGAALCGVGAMVEAFLIGLDIVTGVIPGVALDSFHGFILGRS